MVQLQSHILLRLSRLGTALPHFISHGTRLIPRQSQWADFNCKASLRPGQKQNASTRVFSRASESSSQRKECAGSWLVWAQLYFDPLLPHLASPAPTNFCHQYCYQTLLNGCRLGFYEPIRALTTNATHGNSTTQSPLINLFSGASSGVLGAAIGSPFFLVKTRLQSHSPFLPVGTQHNYKNAIHGFREIFSTEGGKGLYRGVGAAMVRTGFGSSAQLPTYFLAKRQMEKYGGMKDTPATHLMASTASGFVVCCVMHPPDTVMSRLYNQNGNLYTGIWDCLSKTVRAEGFLAIYKGYFAHLARILPHTVCPSANASPHPSIMFSYVCLILIDDLDPDPHTRRTNQQDCTGN